MEKTRYIIGTEVRREVDAIARDLHNLHLRIMVAIKSMRDLGLREFEGELIQVEKVVGDFLCLTDIIQMAGVMEVPPWKVNTLKQIRDEALLADRCCRHRRMKYRINADRHDISTGLRRIIEFLDHVVSEDSTDDPSQRSAA